MERCLLLQQEWTESSDIGATSKFPDPQYTLQSGRREAGSPAKAGRAFPSRTAVPAVPRAVVVPTSRGARTALGRAQFWLSRAFSQRVTRAPSVPPSRPTHSRGRGSVSASGPWFGTGIASCAIIPWTEFAPLVILPSDAMSWEKGEGGMRDDLLSDKHEPALDIDYEVDWDT